MATIDEMVGMIVDCENRSSKLTDWEAGFIDSLQKQIEQGRTPTARQEETLQKIWDKVTDDGGGFYRCR